MKRSFARLFTAALAACAALALSAALPASAQDKIDKPVKILVGFPPGGTADIMARVVAEKMKDSLGQPVIVENRPGAIGRIAADAVKAAPPDGSTIMVMPIGPMAVVPHTYKSLSYDPIKDFAPIGMGSTFQFAIAAGPQSGAKTWAGVCRVGEGESVEVVVRDIRRRQPAAFLWPPARARVGHRAAARPVQGIGCVHERADRRQRADRGRRDRRSHRAASRGQDQILASSGAKRSTAVPDVPTFTELGIKGGEAEGWFGFFAPAKTPKAIVDQLNRSLNQALSSPEIAERLTKLGLDPKTTTPEEFGRILAADYAKWGPVVKASGFTAE